MLFFVENSCNPEHIQLQTQFDYFIFPEEITQHSNHAHAIIKSSDLLDSIFASLKNKRMVILCKSSAQLHIPKDMDKNRLYISPGQFIFLAPRATYFFNQLSANINIESFKQIEDLALSWGK